jgi:hypothetical protein
LRDDEPLIAVRHSEQTFTQTLAEFYESKHRLWSIEYELEVRELGGRCPLEKAIQSGCRTCIQTRIGMQEDVPGSWGGRGSSTELLTSARRTRYNRHPTTPRDVTRCIYGSTIADDDALNAGTIRQVVQKVRQTRRLV